MNFKKKIKLPKYYDGGMNNDEYNMSLYSPEDQAALQGGNGTNNIYNQKRSSANNIGQYAAYAQIAGQTAGNLASINNQDYDRQTKAAYQSEAVGNGLTQSGAAFNPLIGAATGVRKSATGMIGDKPGANRTANNWIAAPHESAVKDFSSYNSAENGSQKFGSILAGVGDITGMTKMRQMFSYGTKNDEKTTGFWGKYNDLSGISGRNNQKELMEASQYRMGGKACYPNGGMMPNSEVELQENSITPQGEFTQYDGPSHENGGVPTNLEPGEMVFSDKLKLGKKTFAQLNKVNNTNREDKILENIKTGSLTKRTAELLKMAKLKNSEVLFNTQESLKQEKVMKYAQKMGMGDKFPLGGTYTPDQYRQAQSDSTILYRAGLKSNKIPSYQYPGAVEAAQRLSLLNGTAPNPVQGQFYGNQVDYNGGYNVAFKKPTMLPYVNQPIQAEFKQAPQQPVYHPTYQQSINGIPKSNYKFRDGGKKSYNDVNDLTLAQQREYDTWFNQASQYATDNNEQFNADEYSLDSYRKVFNPQNGSIQQNLHTSQTERSGVNWGNVASNAGMFLANNAGNIYNLSRYNKPEVESYERANASYLDSSAAIQDADQQTRRAEQGVRNASGGNASNYLSNRVALATQNTMNKDRIRQQYANQNAQIGNQNSQFNSQIAMQEVIANAQNRARTRSGKGEAIGSMGYNIANQMKDNKLSNMDQNTLDIMMKYYDTPEFKKLMKDNKFKK